jgi:Dolichyl-phosphate-mannose-protein mannosyltransferase
MKNPAPSSQQYLQTHSAWAILLLAFLLRLWKASGIFLNPDEAMHFLAANKTSLVEAYHASFALAHPPLLILLLNVWKRFGTSELFLRLPSVVAGTIFCWIFFKWLTRLVGPTTGWVGLILVSFLPPFVELSSEVRQYPLLLCLMIAAAYVLELALAKDSALKMALFSVFMYLAMLSHFSAILFAAAIGTYSLWRVITGQPSRSVVAVWVTGQVGALGLFAYLYQTHIASLRNSADAQHMQVLLGNSYFQPGHGHLLSFAFARTFGVLQYTFGQLAVGDIAGVLFVAAVTLLLSGDRIQQPQNDDPRALNPGRIKDARGPSARQLGLFLLLPFAINCVVAIMGLYPYGGTRHSAFLLPFAAAGVSYAIAKLTRQKLAHALGGTILVVALCQAFGAPHRPYMRREDQRLANMTQAMDAIRHQVSPADVIFVDFQTNFLLRFYLCPDAPAGTFTASGFKEYSCGGYRVISTSPETNILTADIFTRRWSDLVNTYNLKPNDAVWIFQAGWDINLAQELQKKVPEFHDLKAESFGRNITLFKIQGTTAGR